jgi:hypothetical protein
MRVIKFRYDKEYRSPVFGAHLTAIENVKTSHPLLLNQSVVVLYQKAATLLMHFLKQNTKFVTTTSWESFSYISMARPEKVITQQICDNVIFFSSIPIVVRYMQ